MVDFEALENFVGAFGATRLRIEALSASGERISEIVFWLFRLKKTAVVK